MTVTVEGIVKVALGRVANARATAEGLNVYSTGTADLAALKRDLDIAAELLALIVPQQPVEITFQPVPQHDPA